jgi:hypothetical protein
MKLVWAKVIWAGVLTLFFYGCAEGSSSKPVSQAGCYGVQGGPLAGEAMINFPLGLPNDKK